jgi:hypothetical protein
MPGNIKKNDVDHAMQIEQQVFCCFCQFLQNNFIDVSQLLATETLIELS